MTPPEILPLALNTIAPAFFKALGLAALAAPVWAWSCGLAARAQGKAFYAKLGRQVADMGLWLGPCLLALSVVSGWLTALRLSWIGPWLTRADSPFLWAFTCAALAFACLPPLRAGLGRPANTSAAYLLLGLIAVPAAVTALFLVLAGTRWIGRLTLSGADLAPPPPLPELLALPATSLFWPLLGSSLCLSAGLCGVAALLYLLLRRTRDDFGRDYYVFALKLAARSAAVPLLLLLPCLAWLVAAMPDELKALALTGQTAWAGGIGALLFAACAGGLALVARSQNPLRLKGLIVGTGLGAWAGLTLLAAGGLRLFLSL
jgi:hypothetical protein